MHTMYSLPSWSCYCHRMPTRLTLITVHAQLRRSKARQGWQAWIGADCLLGYGIQEVRPNLRLNRTVQLTRVDHRPAFARALEKMKKAEAAGQSKSSL